jgi:hypothetical protein
VIRAIRCHQVKAARPGDPTGAIITAQITTWLAPMPACFLQPLTTARAEPDNRAT